MDEPTVLKKVHSFLRNESVAGLNASRMYSDAHATLIKHGSLAPFHRFRIDFGDFSVHPDLVAQLNDGEMLLAVEGKGESGILNGLFQAEMYQVATQLSFLAAPANCLNDSLIQIAKSKGVGVLAVTDDVQPLHVPEARTPIHSQYRSLMRQMESIAYVSEGGTFNYNIPTHYLLWSIALESRQVYDLEGLSDLVVAYPVPKDLMASLKGASKLGLVSISGRKIGLTDAGLAIKKLLPDCLGEWASIHSRVSARGKRPRLCDIHPQSGAVLRLLLLQDPIVRILVDGLRRFPGQSATFDDLAVACDAIDHARAPIFFLKPESAVRLTTPQCRLDWRYRSC